MVSQPRVLQAITLALQSMSYDFVGTCLDESSEDLGTIQVRLTVQSHAPGTPYVTSHGLNTIMWHTHHFPLHLKYASVPLISLVRRCHPRGVR